MTVLHSEESPMAGVLTVLLSEILSVSTVMHQIIQAVTFVGSTQPMPAKFEIYQVLNNLSEGEYTVKCRQASFVGQLTNMRLFANRNVQYYGNPSDYDKNLNATEVNTFGEIPVALIPVQYCRK